MGISFSYMGNSVLQNCLFLPYTQVNEVLLISYLNALLIFSYNLAINSLTIFSSYLVTGQNKPKAVLIKGIFSLHAMLNILSSELKQLRYHLPVVKGRKITYQLPNYGNIESCILLPT